MLETTLILFLALAGGREGDLAAAAKKAAEMTSYAFKVDTKTDAGKGAKPVALEGRFEKDKPACFKAGALEAFRKGGVVVVKEGEAWKRVEKPAKGERKKVDPAAQALGTVKLPHEELAEFEKLLDRTEKAADGEQTVYSGPLTIPGARGLVSTGAKNEGKAKADFTYSGTAKVWVNKDGAVVKYEYTVTSKGTLKEKEVSTTVTRTVEISEIGTAKVEVPEAAAKEIGG
jgi:hypothetical protein